MVRYKTKQREEILNIIKRSSDQHVTVDFLLQEIEKDHLDISRATLYRYLDLLVGSGVLKKISVDDKTPSCYQLCEHEDHNHFHLVCEKCGKLIHLDCDKIDELIEHIELDHGFKVNPSRVVLYGLCPECRKNS